MYVGGIYYIFPEDDPPTELWAQLYMKTSSNYVWHSIANKLVYMCMGYQNPADGTFQAVHVLNINHQWTDGPNMGWFTQFSKNPDQGQIFYAGTKEFTRDVWHRIVFHIRMNTPGQHNGIGRIWHNDALVVSASDIMWLDTGNFGGIADFCIAPVWGGGGPETVMETQYMYFDHIILQTGPFPGYD
jgi:hypothetical protein